MTKAQQLYVKHLYSTGENQDEDQKKPVDDVIINEISKKFENRYRDRKNDFRDSSNNRRASYDPGQRRWQTQDDRKNLDESSSKHYVSPVSTTTDNQMTHTHFDTTTSHRENVSEQAPPTNTRIRVVRINLTLESMSRRINRIAGTTRHRCYVAVTHKFWLTLYN